MVNVFRLYTWIKRQIYLGFWCVGKDKKLEMLFENIIIFNDVFQISASWKGVHFRTKHGSNLVLGFFQKRGKRIAGSAVFGRISVAPDSLAERKHLPTFFYDFKSSRTKFSTQRWIPVFSALEMCDSDAIFKYLSFIKLSDFGRYHRKLYIFF